jgi:hypothetical protein
MTVRFERAPGDQHGWRSIPPSDVQDCDPDGYDACGDEGGDGEPLDTPEDNKPMAI